MKVWALGLLGGVLAWLLAPVLVAALLVLLGADAVVAGWRRMRCWMVA